MYVLHYICIRRILMSWMDRLHVLAKTLGEIL